MMILDVHKVDVKTPSHHSPVYGTNSAHQNNASKSLNVSVS
jgi:hypothetical protein